MKKITLCGYMWLDEGAGDHPFLVMLRDNKEHAHETRGTKGINLAELIGKHFLELPDAFEVMGWDTVLVRPFHECGKVKITIEQMDEGRVR